MTTADHIEVPHGLQAIYERNQKNKWHVTVDRLDALRQTFAEQRRQIFRLNCVIRSRAP